jgi:hypothetical protein
LQRFLMLIYFRFQLLILSNLSHFIDYSYINWLFFECLAWNQRILIDRCLTRIRIFIDLLILIGKFCLVFRLALRIDNSWFH